MCVGASGAVAEITLEDRQGEAEAARRVATWSSGVRWFSVTRLISSAFAGDSCSTGACSWSRLVSWSRPPVVQSG
ncbi:hypothetical protein PSNTI_03770 [Stutzerimonas stutzeri]|nr:hypothetical protein PSNTI_03770 [Stutzerimonas stutzeri]